MTLASTIQMVMIEIVWVLTVLFLGIAAGRLLRTVISRAFFEARARRILRLNAGLLLARIAEVAAYVVTGVLIGNELGITRIILIGVGVIVGLLVVVNALLHVLFALPDVVMRWYSVSRRLKKGARVEREGVRGSVERKGLAHLVVRTDENDVLIVPYSTLVRLESA